MLESLKGWIIDPNTQAQKTIENYENQRLSIEDAIERGLLNNRAGQIFLDYGDIVMGPAVKTPADIIVIRETVKGNSDSKEMQRTATAGFYAGFVGQGIEYTQIISNADYQLSMIITSAKGVNSINNPLSYLLFIKKLDDIEIAKEKTGNASLTMADLRQDEDVLDTWFSSWLWPISLFNGINDPDNREINYYYPTSDLVTGPDIIFFWVARMIMAGYEYRGKMPFKNVYFTGIVRDKLGRKMSKSLGNSPDPLQLIEQYGADGVRMGLMMAAPAGNDIPFDDALCEQGRNFNNKIWNAFRLIKGWTVDSTIEQPEAAATAVKWFKMQLDKTIAEMDDLFGKYRLSEAMMAVYKLFWDEFSSWYLEMVKPGYQQPVDKSTYLSTLGFFDALLRLLHPFMPFITEELWQALEPRKEGESLMVALIPEVAPVDNLYLEDFEIAKEIVGGVRTIRLQKNIPNKEALELQVLGEHNDHFNAVIAKMCNLSSIIRTEEKTAGSASFLVRTTEYAVPLGNMINVEEELAKLQDELKYQQGFLASVMKKLSNESFVSKAPAKVIEMERKKQADAESKIKSIEESIAALKK